MVLASSPTSFSTYRPPEGSQFQWKVGLSDNSEGRYLPLFVTSAEEVILSLVLVCLLAVWVGGYVF